MKLIIDRIVGQTAVCEDEQEQMVCLDLTLFPATVKEGDIVSWEHDTIRILEAETLKRRTEMKNRMSRLFKK